MPVIKLLNFYRIANNGTATIQDIFIKDEMKVKKSESRSQFEEKSFLLYIYYRPRSD
jgi:hypothetical protein